MSQPTATNMGQFNSSRTRQTCASINESLCFLSGRYHFVFTPTKEKTGRISELPARDAPYTLACCLWPCSSTAQQSMRPLTFLTLPKLPSPKVCKISLHTHSKYFQIEYSSKIKAY
jgi:hypothetical protein